VAPTATVPNPTATAVPTSPPPSPTATAAHASLSVADIAATAVADAAGEECVAAPPKPAKGFIGDPVAGRQLFVERGCSACHGDQAQGLVGPKIAGTTLPFQAVIHQLREPRGVMQRYLPADQSDADECNVYIYLKTLH
jgi:mono/diheme cytochrome c family protein